MEDDILELPELIGGDPSPLRAAKEIIEREMENLNDFTLVAIRIRCMHLHTGVVTAAIKEIYAGDERLGLFNQKRDIIALEAVWDELLQPTGFDTYTSPLWLRVLFQTYFHLHFNQRL